jgi:hypothetical protein
MLHGEYMETIQDAKTLRWRPKEAFKRYHATELWQPFFDACLNIRNCNSLPSLSEWKSKLEQYLVKDTVKSKSIKTSLCKQGNIMAEYEKNALLL